MANPDYEKLQRRVQAFIKAQAQVQSGTSVVDQMMAMLEASKQLTPALESAVSQAQDQGQTDKDIKETYLRAEFTGANAEQLVNEIVEKIEIAHGRVLTATEEDVIRNYTVDNFLVGNKIDLNLPDDSTLDRTNVTYDLRNILSDYEGEVIRWPGAVTTSQKIGILGKQAQEADIIDFKDRRENTDFWKNVKNNMPLILDHMDDISSEREFDFGNIADRLFGYTTLIPRTPEDFELKQRYGGWIDLANPNMESPTDWSNRFDLQQMSEVEQEEYLKKYTEDVFSTFEKRIKNNYPDVKLTAEEKKARDILIADGKIAIQNSMDSMYSGANEATRALSNEMLISQFTDEIPSVIEKARVEFDLKTHHDTIKTTSDARTQLSNAIQSMPETGMGHGRLPSAEALDRLADNYYQHVQQQKDANRPFLSSEEFINVMDRTKLVDLVNQQRVSDYKDTDAFKELIRNTVGLPERPESQGGGEYCAVTDLGKMFESLLRNVPGSVDRPGAASDYVLQSIYGSGEGITPMGDFAPFSGMRMDQFGQPIYESGPEFLENLSLYPWQVQGMVHYARNRPALDIVSERFGGVAPSPPSNIFGEKQTQYFVDDGEPPTKTIDGHQVLNMDAVRTVDVPAGPFTASTPYLSTSGTEKPISEALPPPNITTEPYLNLGFNAIQTSIPEHQLRQEEFVPYPQNNILGLGDYDQQRWGEFSPYTSRPGSGYRGGTFPGTAPQETDIFSPGWSP